MLDEAQALLVDIDPLEFAIRMRGQIKAGIDHYSPDRLLLVREKLNRSFHIKPLSNAHVARVAKVRLERAGIVKKIITKNKIAANVRIVLVAINKLKLDATDALYRCLLANLEIKVLEIHAIERGLHRLGDDGGARLGLGVSWITFRIISKLLHQPHDRINLSVNPIERNDRLTPCPQDANFVRRPLSAMVVMARNFLFLVFENLGGQIVDILLTKPGNREKSVIVAAPITIVGRIGVPAA